MSEVQASLPLPIVGPDLDQELGQPIRRTRDRFATYEAPQRPMSTAGRPHVVRHEEWPEELQDVAQLLASIPWVRERFRWVLRDALDDLIDGAGTGRWCHQHLTRPEQKSLGVAVQVLLTREFAFPSGADLSWRMNGHSVECVFSIDAGAWEIPMEMYRCDDHGDRSGSENGTALLVWMNEESCEWAVGLFHVTDERLRWKVDKTTGTSVRSYTRDNRRRISDEAMSEIYWLWGGIQPDLPENTLLHMHPQRRSKVFADRASGQHRVDELFRACLGEIVRKPTVLTVAQQDDAPKRVRDARKNLQREGIVILGHQESHPVVARALGLPVPEKGEWIAVRLVPVDLTDVRPSVKIEGRRWAVAMVHEPHVLAPVVPKRLSA